MQTVSAVTGPLEDGPVVRLDGPMPLGPGKVRPIVEPVGPSPAPAAEDFEAVLRERQRARGHQPRSKEEIDAQLVAEHASWDG